MSFSLLFFVFKLIFVLITVFVLLFIYFNLFKIIYFIWIATSFIFFFYPFSNSLHPDCSLLFYLFIVKCIHLLLLVRNKCLYLFLCILQIIYLVVYYILLQPFFLSGPPHSFPIIPSFHRSWRSPIVTNPHWHIKLL